MYPQSQLIRRRPRRTLDHLFGDDVDITLPLPPGVVPFNPDAGITRPARPVRTDELAPYEGELPVGSFMGDAAAPVNRPLPAVRPPMPMPEPEPLRLPQPTVATMSAPPAYPAELSRDPVSADAQRLRERRNAPIERSRVKSAGIGLLQKGLPGLISGIADPELYGRTKRDREIKRLENQIGTELEIQKAQRQARREPLQDALTQSQIDENKAQAKALKRPPRPILGREVTEDGTTIQTELNPETGVFEPSTRDGKPIILSRPKTQEPDVRSGNAPVIQRQPDGSYKTIYTPPPDTAKSDEREGQKLAAQDEFDQLVVDETAAGEEKNRAYAYLEQLKANPSTTQDDINEAQKAAEAANVFYRSFGPKKVAAKAKVTRYSGSTRPDRPNGRNGGKYAGQRFSRAKVAERAKSLGMTPEQAEKTISDQGGTIY